jgi:CDP-6-deoxy-D-xylo-4-hexulose-3-dehydrase
MDNREIAYPLASTTWDQAEYAALARVIESGRFTMGKEVSEFEQVFAEFIGTKHAVMFNSGSSANLGLIAAAKYMKYPIFQPGDEVIVPAVSWSTTFYPIHQQELVLSFVDIDIETLNLDLNKVKEAITPKTRAILAVNLLGNPCELTALRALADENGLVLLEDNCESLGAKQGNQYSGTFGLGGTFSTFFSHHISTMEGGLVATNDSTLDETMRSIRAHGWTRELAPKNTVHDKTGDEWDDLFRFVLPGFNLRPLEMEGALGKTQLSKLPSFIDQRRKNAEYLLGFQDKFPSLKLQREIGESSWFGFSLILNNKLSGKRKELISRLDKSGIQSRPIVAGNFARNPVMKHLRHAELPELPNADKAHFDGLFVGNHHYPMESQLDLLVSVLEKFEETYA